MKEVHVLIVSNLSLLTTRDIEAELLREVSEILNERSISAAVRISFMRGEVSNEFVTAVEVHAPRFGGKRFGRLIGMTLSSALEQLYQGSERFGSYRATYVVA